MTLTIPQSISKPISIFSKKILTSNDLGFKLFRVGAGATVAGAGAGTALSLASQGVADAGERTSSVFGIPKDMLLIIGIALIVLVLVVSKR